MWLNPKNLPARHSFPAELYKAPNSIAFNPRHNHMLRYMGLDEVIAKADPQHREWMFLLVCAAYNFQNASQEQAAKACDPIADVPGHCMPAMLWLYKEDPAAYQWILENLDRVDYGVMPMLTYMRKYGVSEWGGWFTWSATPQGYKYWEALHHDYIESLKQQKATHNEQA